MNMLAIEVVDIFDLHIGNDIFLLGFMFVTLNLIVAFSYIFLNSYYLCHHISQTYLYY